MRVFLLIFVLCLSCGVIRAQTGFPVDVGPPFPYSTGVVTNTNSCNQHYKTACTTGCLGDILTFSGCGGLLTQDTYFKLYLGNEMVSENDDFCGAVSQIRYTVTTEGCNSFCLHMGCFALSSCSMNVTATLLVSTTMGPTVQASRSPTPSPSLAPSSFPSAQPVGGRPTSWPSSVPSSAPSGIPHEIIITDFGDSTANASLCLSTADAPQSCNLRSAWAACGTIPTYSKCIITIPPASNITFLNFDYGGLVLTENFNIEINGQNSVIHAQVGTLPDPVPAGGDFPWSSGPMENTDYCSVNYTTACVSGCFGDVITFSACGGDTTQDTYFKLYIGNNSYIPGSNGTQGTLVAENDDACDAASRIQYAVTESGCNQLCLNMGCFSDSPCVANVTATRVADLDSPRFIYYQHNYSDMSNFIPRLTVTNLMLSGFGGDELNGGSVYLSGEVEATFSQVTFHNSSGGLGGSLYVTETSHSVTVDNCTFEYSQADFGGAIYLDTAVNAFLMVDSRLLHCNGTSGGGGMYVAHANIGVSVMDSVFEDCASVSAVSSSGGGIVLDSNNNDFLLSGVIFEHCYTMFFGGAFASLNYNDNTIITGCTILDCHGEYGGGIFANQFIVGFTIAHTTIDSCSAFDGSGGGIYLLYDIQQVVIYDVSIDNCFAMYYAGGLYMFVFVTDAMIIDTSITNSVSKSSGGCFSSRFFNDNAFLSNMTFVNCTAGKEGGCLSVSQYNTGFTLTNSSFDNCLAYSNGGAINVDLYNTGIVFEHLSISNGYAADSGGAITFDTGNSNISLSDVRIEYAQALSDGGAMSFNSDNDNIQLHELYIQHCVTKGNGGCISFGSDHMNVFILQSVIMNGTAASGGGLYFDQRNLNVEFDSVAVRNCHALSSYGGGLYVHEDNMNFTLISSEFSGCSAVSGGGLSTHINNTFVSIAGCNISDNKAVVYGAGFFVEGDTTNLLITDKDGYYRSTTLQSQHPYLSGYPSGNVAFEIFSQSVLVEGAEYFVLNFSPATTINTASDFINIYTSSNLSEASLLFSSTSLMWPGVDIPSLIITGNSFYFEFVGTNSFDVIPTGVEDDLFGFECFVFPVLSDPEQPTVFGGNDVQAGSGGGFYLHSSSPFPVFLNMVMEGNSAKQGGGMFIRDNNNGVSVVQANFTNNEASFDGGGLTIYVTNYGYSLVDCLFQSNHANRNGGGVNFVTGNGEGEFQLDNEIRFFKAIFSNNSAPVGGAMTLQNDNICTFENCLFEGNYATDGPGGGIYLGQDNILTLQSTLIHNNSAFDNGGGLSSTVSNTLYLYNTNMTMNYAGSGGGAIDYEGATDVIFGGNVLLQGNTARFAGGAVLCEMSSLWSMTTNATVVVDSNSASVGSAFFFHGLLTINSKGSMETLHDMVVSNNVAKVGGTLYWLYDSGMPTEPKGIYSDSVIWKNNEAPYGTVVGTQATSLLGPQTYDVTVYNSALNPPLSFSIYDYYGQSMPLNGTTSVTVSIGNVMNCGAEYGSLAGDDMTGDGVAITDGVAHFASLEVYCTPSGDLTLEFEARLGDMLGISAAMAMPYYVRNTTQLLFRSCVAGESYTTRECVECAQGSYSLFDNSASCSDCLSMPGVDTCYADQIFVEGGYYRSTNVSSAESIMSCPYSHACIGGNLTGSALCAVGYTGPLCKVCDVGYFGVDNLCLPCASSTIITPILIGYMIIGLLMLITAAVAFLVYTKVCVVSKPHTETVAPTEVDDKSFTGARAAWKRKRASELFSRAEVTSTMASLVKWVKVNFLQATAKIKIVVATYQIISAVSMVLAVSMPRSFTSFAGIASFLNLNVSDALPLACSNNVTFIDHLVMVTLLPMALLGVLVVAFGFEYMYYRRLIQANKSRKRGDKRRKFEEVRDKYASYFFYLTYIVLPSVTTTIFQMFPCTNMDPQDESGNGQNSQLFLTADMSISCTSSYYYDGVAYATVMIFVYPVGITLLYFYLLYSHREAIGNREKLPEDVRESYDVNGAAVPVSDDAGGDMSDSAENSAVSVQGLSVTSNPLRSSISADIERPRTESSSSVATTDSSLSVGDEEAMSQYLSQFNVPINVRRVAFLWSSYQPRYWYWEVIETTRRLMLTAVLSICSPGSSSQGVLSLVLAVMYIRIYSTFRPYTRLSDNALSEAGQLQVFFTFFCALIVQNNLLNANWTGLLGGCLVLANLGVLTICVFFIFYSSYSISGPGGARPGGEDCEESRGHADDGDNHNNNYGDGSGLVGDGVELVDRSEKKMEKQGLEQELPVEREEKEQKEKHMTASGLRMRQRSSVSDDTLADNSVSANISRLEELELLHREAQLRVRQLEKELSERNKMVS